MSNFTESAVEDAALAWLEGLGYTVKHLPAPQNDTTGQAGGPEIGPGEIADKWTYYGQVVPVDSWRQLLQKMQQFSWAYRG